MKPTTIRAKGQWQPLRPIGAALPVADKDAKFDYTKKRGVVLSEIIALTMLRLGYIAVKHCGMPVERAEKHPRAQLARDCVIALPHELTDDQRHELVRQFVIEQFVSKGMIADLAIHRPRRITATIMPT